MKESLQSETVISIRGLTKCYSDNTVANKGIDLDVYEGRVLSILGPNARRDVWNLVNEVKRWGRTVILTTHYLEEAELLSDRIGILQRGELKRLGTLEDLYRSMPKTYRLVYNGVSTATAGVRNERIVYDAADFDAVKKIIEERALTEYSVRRVSLEDVYLELIDGERKNDGA